VEGGNPFENLFWFNFCDFGYNIYVVKCSALPKYPKGGLVTEALSLPD